MKIDRYNYEEFFLLYIDNELTVEQKREVDLFVKENPDLEEELVMLQQSRLIPDDSIVFDAKHLLMKETTNTLIDLNNYEEWLILYVDNELGEEDKTRVEKFAAEHSHVQQQLSLFLQTKLPQEKIVFANKKVLYRTEKPRVISIQWWKVAAAAMLIVAAGTTTYLVLHKSNNTTGNLATTNKEQRKVETRNGSNDQKDILSAEQKKAIAIATSPVKKQPGKEKSIKDNGKKLSTGLRSQQIALEIPREKPAIIENSDIISSKEPGIKNVIAVKDNSHKQIINDTTVTKNLRQTPEPMYAQNTDNSENKRLRGFFRKATRLIEHATKINPADDDNRVLIGGMAINLK